MIDVDAHAGRLRHFHPTMITGMFHSPDYARSCIEAANFGRLTDVDAAVTARLERGLKLRGPTGTPYHVVLGEAALRWVPAAGEQATVETLRNLLAASDAEKITVQIIPTGKPMTALPQVGFYMVDWKDSDESPMVIVETPAAELTFVGAEECADFEASWQQMSRAGLNPTASRDFISKLLNEHGTNVL